jgi:SAM-dependent methyltransferase
MENQPAKFHVSSGLRKILEHSFVYNLWQLGIGGESVHRSFINDYCKPHKHASILEIGCGTGTILEHIDKDLNVTYYGYDENPTYIDFAKRKYGDRGRFYCVKVSDANIPAGGFDIVLALGILHHLNEHEALKLIESAWDNLRPGGFLFSADPVWTNTQSRLEKYLISKDRGQSVRTEEGYKHLLSTRFDSIESQIVSGLLNIPWTANIIKATKTTSSSV